VPRATRWVIADADLAAAATVTVHVRIDERIVPPPKPVDADRPE
jgi:hypothetical protein